MSVPNEIKDRFNFYKDSKRKISDALIIKKGYTVLEQMGQIEKKQYGTGRIENKH